MSASRLRTVSQVWPPWLPGALTGVKAPAPFHSASSKAHSTYTSCTARPVPRKTRTRPNRLRPAASLTNHPITSSFFRQQPQHLQQQQIRAFHHADRSCQNRRFTTTHSAAAEVTSLPSQSHAPEQAWSPPSSLQDRPICILGSGVLGRRLAVLYASRSRPVTLYDTSSEALNSSRIFIADSLADYCAEHNTHPSHVSFSTTLEEAVQNAWMVIDCVPEDLELKTSLLGRVDALVPKDVLIATNSAGFRSKELISEVFHKERVLNTLYYIPPKNRCVELMTSGYTSSSIIPFLVEHLQEMGLKPIVVPGKGDKGMIFPRIWGAMRKEALKVLSEGVADPEEVDILFKDFFGAESGICEMMDEVGLDTVVKSERRRLPSLREGDGFWGARGEEYVEWLEREFVSKGKLGVKSGGGLVASKMVERRYQGETVRDSAAGWDLWKNYSVDTSGL